MAAGDVSNTQLIRLWFNRWIKKFGIKEVREVMIERRVTQWMSNDDYGEDMFRSLARNGFDSIDKMGERKLYDEIVWTTDCHTDQSLRDDLQGFENDLEKRLVEKNRGSYRAKGVRNEAVQSHR